MKAIGQIRYGNSDVLEVMEVDKPEPGDGEVLVKVNASSINSIDWHLMTGEPWIMRITSGIRGPKQRLRGYDVTGVVEAIGENVSGFKPGDEVFGTGEGAFAEYVCAPVGQIALKPPEMTTKQAASMGVAAVTALEGLRDEGLVQSGHKVLINGASGGVGTFAVQIGKALGAEVTAVCRTDKVETVSSLGADRVIDYTKEDFTRTGDKYDVLFDGVANRSIRDCRRALTPKGTMVLSGGTGSKMFGPIGQLLRAKLISPFVGNRFPSFIADVTTERLESLAQLFTDGKVKPVIDTVLPLEEARQGMRKLEERTVQGKVVLTV